MSDSRLAPATQRAARLGLLFGELRAILRHEDPHLAEDALTDEAAFHAARRLAGGSLMSTFIVTPR